MSKPPDPKDLGAYVVRTARQAKELNEFFVARNCNFVEAMNLVVIVLGSQIDAQTKDKTADERRELVEWSLARIGEQIRSGFALADAAHGKTKSRN